MRARGLGLMALLAAAGCVRETQLRPLANAETVAGDKEAVATENAGVRLVADGDAWRGNPGNLEQRVTPVEVRLENHSGRPLRVKYGDFALVGESRFRYSAIPPLALRDTAVSQAPETGTGGAGSVGLAWSTGWGPYSSRYGYGYGRGRGRFWGWPGGFYDPFWGSPFYGPYAYPYRHPEPLPTQDMLNKALPEGTLEDGGTVVGFLYFQGVADREASVTLQAKLVDANTGEAFGSLGIPFQVSK